MGLNTFQTLYGQDVEKKSASLSIINSTFENIEYGHVVLEASEQTLEIKACQFHDIRLWDLATQCDDLGSLWCQTFLSCTFNSTCRLDDLCIEGFEYASEGSLMAIDTTSRAFLSGTNYRSEVNRFAPAMGGTSEVCPSGVIQIEMLDFEFYPVACVEPETIDKNWTATETCSLQ